MTYLVIDGAQGEGGGQVLRTALTLSIITKRPIEIVNIRANRKKPGLLRQHLTAVMAAQAICNATTEGVELWGECYSIENTTEILLPSSGLTGEIPESIGSLNNLNSLVLYNNQLIGILPESITNLNNLTWLNLYNNQLTGEIPQDIGNLTNLTTLDLGFNQFIGELPESLGDLTNLNHLWLFNNQLNGEIPATICDVYQNLEHFFIYNNQLCPPYPDCLLNQEPFTDENENGIWDEGEPFFDCGLDQICPDDKGYKVADFGEGNGKYDKGEKDGIWKYYFPGGLITNKEISYTMISHALHRAPVHTHPQTNGRRPRFVDHPFGDRPATVIPNHQKLTLGYSEVANRTKHGRYVETSVLRCRNTP